MRLGIAYHAFNACELLQLSVEWMRPLVDYIAVVWHSRSYSGVEISSEDRKAIAEAGKAGAELYQFDNEVNGHPATQSQMVSRNVGFALCKMNHCTHFLTMDCDEFYDPNEFKRAQSIAQHVDASACQMVTYYHDDEHRFISENEGAWVPFICRADSRWILFDEAWPVHCDPTRKVHADSMLLLSRSILQMHHLSHVRRDYRSKLENAARRPVYRHSIDDLVAWYDNWQDGMDAFLPVAGKVQLTKCGPFLKGKLRGWNHETTAQRNQEQTGLRNDSDSGGNGDIRGENVQATEGSVSDGSHDRTTTGEVGAVCGPVREDGDSVSHRGQPDNTASDCQSVPIEALPVVS